MQKAFNPITWKNLPSTETALEAANLNRIEQGLNTVDNRVVEFDTSKANQAEFLSVFKEVAFNSATGQFTFTRENNTTKVIDTDIEKIAVNFTFDAVTQELVLTLSDGSTVRIPLSALITEYDFQDTATIHFSVVSGKVRAEVIDGSITESKLQPNFLADIRVESAKAEAAADSALASELNSEAWAVGKKNGADIPTSDPQYENNSEYYAGQAENSAANAYQSKVDAQGILEQVQDAAGNVVFSVDFATGLLMYTDTSTYNFSINTTTGNLEWEVNTWAQAQDGF